MSTETKRNSKVTYWKTQSGHTWFTLDNKFRTPTKIGIFGTLEVRYNYDCEQNTYRYDPAPVRVSKKCFMAKMKELQAKYGVKFSIKTEWGTNVSQSSNLECED